MTILAQDFIKQVAKVSTVIGWQAGVGARETAGAIMDHLAEHPDKLDGFMATGVLDWPDDWIIGGTFTYHAADGKVWHPEDARAARLAKDAVGGSDT